MKAVLPAMAAAPTALIEASGVAQIRIVASPRERLRHLGDGDRMGVIRHQENPAQTDPLPQGLEGGAPVVVEQEDVPGIGASLDDRMRTADRDDSCLPGNDSSLNGDSAPIPPRCR